MQRILDFLATPVPSDPLPSTPTMLSYFSSRYFQVLLFEAILNNRIRQIAVPIVPQGLSLRARCAMRIPLGLGLAFVSTALLSTIPSGSPNFSFLSSSPLGLDAVFCILFAFQCIHHSVDTLTRSLESRSSFQQDSISTSSSANLVEWTMSFHFYSLSQKAVAATAMQEVTGVPPLATVAFLHSVLLGLSNVMSLFNVYEGYKFIPTTVIGLCQLVYFVHRLLCDSPDYPVVFFVAHLPELFIIVLLAFAYGVYGLSWVLNGRNVRPLPSRYPSVPLSEDFGTVLLNTGLTVLKTTRSIGLLTEMDPIHLPLAVGLSPAVSAQLAQKARRRFSDETPLNRNLDQEALRQSSSSRQQLANSGVLVDVLWRQWALLFMYLFTALELCVMFTIRILTGFRFRPRAVPSSQQTRLPSSTINPLFFDSELEESLDPDYVPGEGDDDLVSEQTTSSDSSDLEEEEDSDDDQRTLNENVPQRGEEDIYQELFDLARDIHENDGEASPSFDPLPRFLAWMSASPSGSKRYWTRSSSVSAIGEGLPISPQRNSFALTSLPTFGETRLCVICQAEKRSIVLRPCGCLCLCDEGCRQSLAARKFRDCPCCRREILGYSKIFEP